MKDPEKYLTFAGPHGWRAWLEAHHADTPEAWLMLSRSKARSAGLKLAEAVEQALCYGWVDSLLHPVSSDSYLLRFTPRKPRSIWSEINKRRALRLIREGLMTPAGLEKIAEAKANGRWRAATAREGVNTIPADLERGLRKKWQAWVSFQNWSASKKKQYLQWLASAKRSETRERRVNAIVKLAGGEGV